MVSNTNLDQDPHDLWKMIQSIYSHLTNDDMSSDETDVEAIFASPKIVRRVQVDWLAEEVSKVGSILQLSLVFNNNLGRTRLWFPDPTFHRQALSAAREHPSPSDMATYPRWQKEPSQAQLTLKLIFNQDTKWCGYAEITATKASNWSSECMFDFLKIERRWRIWIKSFIGTWTKGIPKQWSDRGPNQLEP